MEVIVKGPGAVEHKGRIYLPGEPLSVEKKEAERLLAKGKAEPRGRKEKPGTAKE